MNTTHYSVIVPTHNRAEALRSCIEALVEQSVEATQYEIIVVDDGSTDDTVRIVKEAAARYTTHTIRLFSQSNKGCASARNVGVKQAQGAILFFTDDDCIVPPEWIAAHADAYVRYPEVMGVGGWYWPVRRRENRFYRYFELRFEVDYPGLRQTEIVTNTMGSPVGNTANVSYKAELFREVGLFDEQLTFTGGVDWELKCRIITLGKPLLYLPLAVEHTKEMNLWSFFTKSILQGRGIHYRELKFGESYDYGLRRGILLNWELWQSNLKTRNRYADIHLLWLVGAICGRWVNYYRRLRPVPYAALPVAERYTRIYFQPRS